MSYHCPDNVSFLLKSHHVPYFPILLEYDMYFAFLCEIFVHLTIASKTCTIFFSSLTCVLLIEPHVMSNFDVTKNFSTYYSLQQPRDVWFSYHCGKTQVISDDIILATNIFEWAFNLGWEFQWKKVDYRFSSHHNLLDNFLWWTTGVLHHLS